VKALLIDNYDSFSYNLLQLIGGVTGTPPLTRRNDEIDLEGILGLGVDCVILSPGPGRPDRKRDFGVCREVLKFGRLPTLGVCLGHQGIGFDAGARVVEAPEPMHGRVSRIRHQGSGLFRGIPSPFEAVRYHSLMLPGDVPDCLRITARSTDGLIMGIEHDSRPFWGVQFHPESILTEHGDALIRNFYGLAERHCASRSTVFPVTDARSGAGRAAPGSTDEKPLRVAWRRLETDLDAEAIHDRLYRDAAESFWLDSARVIDGYSRFSFMGDATGPRSETILYDLALRGLEIRRHGEREHLKCSIFDYLRQRLDSTRIDVVDDEALPFEFRGGWVGFLGYELKALCGAEETYQSNGHDAAFILADRFVAVDHDDNTTWLVHLTDEDDLEAAGEWMDETERRLARPEPPRVQDRAAPRSEEVVFTARHSRHGYLDRIHQAQDEIRRGESYEVCLTNEIRSDVRPDPIRLYRILRETNPAPYAALLRFPELTVLSSSPERFLKIDRDGMIEAKPIKGTAPRGRTEMEDHQLARELAASEKDRSENLMIVDLLRNDLGVVCEIDSVHVPKLMAIETYQTVHQMVSTIRGQLLNNHTPVDAVQAAFPGGSMTGAPKIRTMEIIDRLEEGPRGVYSGAIGYFGFDGSVDLNIVIRTVVLDDDGISIGCGGAITFLSDADAEYREMCLKAMAPMRAVTLACGGGEDQWVLADNEYGPESSRANGGRERDPDERSRIHSAAVVERDGLGSSPGAVRIAAEKN